MYHGNLMRLDVHPGLSERDEVVVKVHRSVRAGYVLQPILLHRPDEPGLKSLHRIGYRHRPEGCLRDVHDPPAIARDKALPGRGLRNDRSQYGCVLACRDQPDLQPRQLDSH